MVTLAERTPDQRDYRRAAIYAVPGRFTSIRTSDGTPVAGPGIAALLQVDLTANELQRAIVFGDPGAGADPPAIAAKAIAETPANGSTESTDPTRPSRVVVTVSGLFAGVDAGLAGSIVSTHDLGAIAVLDLFDPGTLDVLAIGTTASGVTPIVFGEPVADSEGFHATVAGAGVFDRATDLRGLSRSEAGSGLSALLDLRSGAVERLDVLG